MILLELFGLSFLASALSFGGVHGALPEWRRVFVAERGWVTDTQLMDSYIVGQFVPGPSMVVSTLLGLQVAGLAGAAAALLGTYTPSVLFAFAFSAILRKADETLWIRRVQLALSPIVLGFMAAAACAFVRAQLDHLALGLLLVGAAAAVVYARRLLSPLPLLFASGAAYWLLRAAALLP